MTRPGTTCSSASTAARPTPDSPTSPTPNNAKTKYDFACYRQDNLGFEVLKSSNWNFAGNYQNLAGQTVAVSSGTNQEKILLEVLPGSELHLPGAGFGQDHRVLHAEPVDRLSRQADREHAEPDPIRSAGKYSGAGATLQGLICATTKKGDGLAQPIADAINYLIKNGQYTKWLAAWNLANEAVPSSRVNPPGLPLSNS